MKSRFWACIEWSCNNSEPHISNGKSMPWNVVISCLRICLRLLSNFGRLGSSSRRQKKSKNKNGYSFPPIFRQSYKQSGSSSSKTFRGGGRRNFLATKVHFYFPTSLFSEVSISDAAGNFFFPFFSQRLSEMHSVWKSTEINSIQNTNLVLKTCKCFLQTRKKKVFGTVKSLKVSNYKREQRLKI